MSGRVLAANVLVDDPASGMPRVFEAGSVPPQWAAEQITNEECWADQHDAAPAGDGRPPLAGPGSGRDAWAEYAESLGISVPDDASRSDIVDLVDSHTNS